MVMLLFLIPIFLASNASSLYASISALIAAHGYISVIILMAAESASLPIPSEVILPVTGFFVHNGTLNLYLAIIASLVGTFIGITIDYYIAYFLEKDVVYKHLKTFHISKERMDNFQKWFDRNGSFAVFIIRMLPIARGLISFPAGFARMDLKKFYLYSLLGSLIWNVALIGFGYYALSTTNADITFAAIAVFAILLYVIYRVAIDRMKK